MNAIPDLSLSILCSIENSFRAIWVAKYLSCLHETSVQCSALQKKFFFSSKFM